MKIKNALWSFMTTKETDDQLEGAFDSVDFLARLSTRPGVYQMFDAQQKILYVGKAKNLKNRLASYFRNSGLGVKTRALVSHIHSIDVTITHSETEALLLEQNLIKQQRPPYNILLRDDKSYPYILIQKDHAFPAVVFHRGAKKKKGHYFGPYPSGGAVKESLNLLQKIFKIRQCDDSVYRNRSRPCLQYQIKRCSAPCVGFIDEQSYADDIRHATMFLQGRNQAILNEIAMQMDTAAQQLQFEKAATLRDQISSLRQIQEQQSIFAEKGDVDVIGYASHAGSIAVHILFVRGGRVLGTKTYHPKVCLEGSDADILSAFVAQFYLNGIRDIPAGVILPFEIDAMRVIADAVESNSTKKIQFSCNVRGDRAAWQRLAQANAEQQLRSFLTSKETVTKRFLALQALIGLHEPLMRIECFDISHSSGEATVASCVVFNEQGPLKSDYRYFNIEGIEPGDDYAAMGQALMRRYTHLKKGEGKMPDLLVIDGGKGQVKQAVSVLNELQVIDVCIIGVAKGTTRKAGFEYLVRGDTGAEQVLPADSPALHLLQHIRDEAHRFAITGHRNRRAKSRKKSKLEEIEGIGQKRRQALLKYFGSIKAIEDASLEEIAKVSGMSTKLAEHLWHVLHPNS